MYYKKQDCLRWEYLKPDNYCFIVNHGKVVMKRDGKTSQNSEVKLFGKISKIILSGISGNNIVDTKKLYCYLWHLWRVVSYYIDPAQ